MNASQIAAANACGFDIESRPDGRVQIDTGIEVVVVAAAEAGRTAAELARELDRPAELVAALEARQ